LPSAYERKYQRIDQLTRKLVTRSKLGTPIIVEGRKDKLSLRRLGVEGKILCVKSTGVGFFDFIEKVKPWREAIILTDFDREGKELSSHLVKELSRIQIKADDSLWRELRSLGRSEIRSVEELANYLEKLKQAVTT
jgi:5S rRNA maturation endonuclease (ribonuclease M5)